MIEWFRGRRLVPSAAVVLIVVLSLLPGAWQERTGLPPHLEHFIAYWGTAGLMGLVWPGGRRAIRHVILLAALSALMEYLQHFSPGRDPRFSDILWSSGGAVVGAGMALLVAHFDTRWRPQHDP